MKSIQNQYRDLKEGRMSQANFMRNLRMTMPQYVTNVTSFNDSVRILKNKGILAESHEANTMWIERFINILKDRGAESIIPDNIDLGEYEGMTPEQAANKFLQPVRVTPFNTLPNDPEIPFMGMTEGAYTGKSDMIITLDYDNEITKIEDKHYHWGPDGSTDYEIDTIKSNFDYNDTLEIVGDLIRKYKWNKIILKVIHDGEEEEDVFNAGNWKGIGYWLKESDIYGIAGDPEKEADARAMAIKRKKQDLEDDELDDLINKYDTEKQGEEDILSQWDPLEEGIDNETAQDIAMNATSFEDAVNRLWDEGVDMDIAREIAGQYHDEELYESKKGKSLHPNQIHPQELRMGMQVEMEHTDDPKKAEKIALDHLAENPFYYTQLKLSGVDTKALPTKEKKAIAKKKDETELVDKANQMKPVKGVEKVKASANKAHKETNKGVSGVQLMSLVAKSSRGVKKMDPTGEKSKKISVKESFLNEDHLTDKQDQIDYILKSGIYAGSREYLNKQTDERIQHLYDKVEKEVKGGNLGAAFNKFKEHLESLVREVLSEMKK
jgi:hypothetical protein